MMTEHRQDQMSQLFDVVVIGGGAAGLSAALVLGRARRSVIVIDAGAAVNADLIAEDTRRAVAVYRDRLAARAEHTAARAS